MKGFNACLFAYGQTGSGKSYSMMGSPDDKGVIPRLCEDLFGRAAERASTHSMFVEVSYLEIYNESVKDLLNPAGIDKSLRVRNHPKLGVFVEGLKKIAARSADDIAKLIDDGTAVRTIASTAMNATSSRSHAILSLNIRVKSTETETMSVCHLVDLAGSERADSTGAEGATLKEGANINKSLSVLGMCLARLAEVAEGKKGGHIPFRDSQLTWLLHESLGGNSRTAMLAALSPADINYEETLSTLRFASITRKIKMVTKINEDPQQKIIRELREQIAQIKEEIKALAEGRILQPPPAPIEEQYDDDVEVGAAAGDSLPQEVDLDVRRQQLLEELEENTNLIVEWSRTDEQRQAQEDKDRVAHEKLMEKLKAGSKMNTNTLVEENSPKFLLLNEDLRQLRGADGKPLAIVHTMHKPAAAEKQKEGSNSRAGSAERPAAAETNNDESGDLLASPLANKPSTGSSTSVSVSALNQHNNNNNKTNRSRSRSMVDGSADGSLVPFSICGPSGTAHGAEFDDSDAAIPPFIRLPAISGLTLNMRLDVIVDFKKQKLYLEFEDNENNRDVSGEVSSTSSSSANANNEIVFVNGKPLRTLLRHQQMTEEGDDASRVEIHHNDRVIIGGVIFRVFEPVSWRVEQLGGQDETFIEEATNTNHLEMLESFGRLSIENEAFEAFGFAVFGDDEFFTRPAPVGTPNSRQPLQFPESGASPVPQGGGGDFFAASSSFNHTTRGLIAPDSLNEIRSSVKAIASEARLARAQAEERLIEHYPRDVRRELRARDVKDSIKFDGKFALSERTVFLQAKQKEQEELQRKLEEGEAEIQNLQESLEQKQRAREEADRKAKEQLDAEVQAALKKAKEEAELKRQQGATNSGAAVPNQVTAVKSTAQGKLQLARRVHEYEELRRELMSWKPAGPTDPRDKPIYENMSNAMGGNAKVIPTYLDVRKNFDEELYKPIYQSTSAYKNRIKTGFFSRGGLHQISLLIIDHFLFYFEAGAGLVSPAASQKKTLGFAYVLGCEYVVMKELMEGKPGVKVISCAPRKAGTSKTDAHHPLEFAFDNEQQRSEFAAALEEARLPKPDKDVADALKKLESQ
jgi:hypothetical protein